MIARQCLDLGRPGCERIARNGSRCDSCERRRRTAYGGDYPRRRLEVIGLPCELRLPGCTGIADTADHVIAVAAGGADGPLRPACGHCNKARGARPLED